MMKRLLTRAVLAIALASGLALAAPAKAGVSAALAVRADVGFFYDDLAPYGSWVTVAAYGDVWVPRVPRWWRPYSEGHWVFTDDGWCWVDDEPWGWAAFHYGRWYLDPVYGWVWIPGTVWAPAWVAWRWGDGFVGWAPLPPEAGWSVGFGLSFTDFDLDRRVGPSYWCFVDQRHFTDPRVYSYLAPTTNNITYVRMTRNITNYTVVNNRVFNRGVDVRQVEGFTGRPVPRLRIVDRQDPGPVHATARALSVYRPSVTAGPARGRGPRFETSNRHGAAVRPQVVQRPPAENLRRTNTNWNQNRTRLPQLRGENTARSFNRVNPQQFRRENTARTFNRANPQQFRGENTARTFKGANPQQIRRENTARTFKGANPQQSHGQQYVEKRALPHQVQPARQVVNRRVQVNPGANANEVHAPNHRTQNNPGAQPKGGKKKGNGNGNG